MVSQERSVSTQREKSSQKEDDAERLAEIAAEYDRQEIETEYPIPEIDDVEEFSKSEPTRKIFKSNLSSDIYSFISYIRTSTNKVINHKDTLQDSGVVDTVETVNTIGSTNDPRKLEITMKNGRTASYKWEFNKEHTTELQRFVDYYADGDIANIQNTKVYVDENGHPILPKASNQWFLLTNNLRPYGLTHKVRQDKKSNIETILPKQRILSIPHYDFSMDAYVKLCGAMLPITVIATISVSSAFSSGSSVVLALAIYLVFHLANIVISIRSSNDSNGLTQFLFPWLMSIIGFILIGIGAIYHAGNTISYIRTLFKDR